MSGTTHRPLCFVLMPFGIKRDPTRGVDVNFDDIYETGIRRGIEAAGLEPIRADEERVGGIIHKPMFERLLLCEYAVADLTTANANVFYELGVRHAVRPSTTLALFARHQTIPFDVAFLRAMPYDLGSDDRFGPQEAAALARALTERLEELKTLSASGVTPDSPVFQLLQDYPSPDISRLKTDVFRERTEYAADKKRQLMQARAARRRDDVHAVEAALGDDLQAVEVGVLVDLFLSYRAVSDWAAMVALYERLPAAVRRTVMVREQLGFAFNRLGRRDEALRVLEEVLAQQGASSETCGLVGRVYKDLWVDARQRGEQYLASGYLDRAVDMYVRGFEADIRDAYPGINAVTLLDVKGDPQSLALQAELLPVVRYAVRRRLRTAKPDYWDHATLLELAVLAHEQSEAFRLLSVALAAVREPWEPATTANNLTLIRDARQARSADVSWLGEVIGALERHGTTTQS